MRLVPVLSIAACPLATNDDFDHDGWPAPADCDDLDPGVYPGAEDPIDGVDQDCDGADGPAGDCAAPPCLGELDVRGAVRGVEEEGEAGTAVLVDGVALLVGIPGAGELALFFGDPGGDRLSTDAAFRLHGVDGLGGALAVAGDALAVGAAPEGAILVLDRAITPKTHLDLAPRLSLPCDGCGRIAASGAGDVDGDGEDDLVGGIAPAELFGSCGGTAALFYGPLDGARSAALPGPVGTCLPGWSVVMLGDVDGDGFDDVAAGDPRNAAGEYLSGLISVHRGPDPGAEPDAVVYSTDVGGFLGHSVAAAGDVDGDGRADLAAGEPGRGDLRGAVHLLVSPLRASTDAADSWATWEGEEDGDQAGSTVLAGQDLDGDGAPDLLAVGQTAGADMEGVTWVVLGPQPGTWTFDRASARLGGEARRDDMGRSLAIGDLDGDGIAEVVAGAPGNDAGAPGGGAAVVFSLAAP